MKAEFEKIVSAEGQKIIAWRDVPVIDSCIGEIAKEANRKLNRYLFQAHRNRIKTVLKENFIL